MIIHGRSGKNFTVYPGKIPWRCKKSIVDPEKKSIVDSEHNSWSIQENMVDPEKKFDDRSRKSFMVDPEPMSWSIQKKFKGRSKNKFRSDPEKTPWSSQKNSMVDFGKIHGRSGRKSMVCLTGKIFQNDGVTRSQFPIRGIMWENQEFRSRNPKWQLFYNNSVDFFYLCA